MERKKFQGMKFFRISAEKKTVAEMVRKSRNYKNLTAFRKFVNCRTKLSVLIKLRSEIVEFFFPQSHVLWAKRAIFKNKFNFLVTETSRWTLTFQKFGFIFFNESPLKIMNNVFYFILKALSVLNIHRFLSGVFWSCRKTS